MTDQEWARSVQQRLAALERPSLLRVGDWTIEVDGHGALVVSRDGRSVRIAGVQDAVNVVDRRL